MKQSFEKLFREIGTIKDIKVIPLNAVVGNKYNIDFGGRELLSTEFNNFLDRRFNEKI